MQLASPISGDAAGTEAEAFVSRGGVQQVLLCRRSSQFTSDSPLAPGSRGGGERRSTFREDVSHAAAETYLVTRLAFILLRYLGLDLYIPRDQSKPSPVVAFVTGGAWIIGNFPQGTISDMVCDASDGISFVCETVSAFGGDPNQYNIQNLVDHFHERGLYRSIFLSIMEGEGSLPHFSPEIVAKKSSPEAISLLPQIVLLHGTEDYSIPFSASETFAGVLKQAGAKTKLLLYEGKTHTDVFLQDPLRGGKDKLVEDVISVIHADDTAAREKDALAPIPDRLVSEWQIKLARRISPF
uniref:Peptidase S9 prolyl oligopeptidase catalytic domain-containing protein n=1 Tax=Leersia perrieri TaxID=77586 RepID=A0A0D9WK39_9ORYZ